MKQKLRITLLLVFTALTSYSQVISIVGTGVNGWPGDMVGPEMDMVTTDNITYTLNDVAVSTGEVKFRQDHDWTTNWGGSTFPSGTGTQGGVNIPTVAGTYDITFNRSNGTYTFIGSSAFPSIGIWGPAVDSQNGFGGPDVDMASTDGITYRLSAFWFSSGSAVFRQDDNSLITYGSTSFPSGTAVASGPNISVTGGQFSVEFNRTTGAYNFYYPSVGILGTFNDWGTDVNFTTSNGENYILENFTMPADGFVKLRLDDQWLVNWGGDGFPSGTLVLNGNDMPVAAGTYNVSFNRNTLEIIFSPALGIEENAVSTVGVYPNPSRNSWNFSSTGLIEKIEIFDMVGKMVIEQMPAATDAIIDASALESGMYLAKINVSGRTKTLRLIRA